MVTWANLQGWCQSQCRQGRNAPHSRPMRARYPTLRPINLGTEEASFRAEGLGTRPSRLIPPPKDVPRDPPLSEPPYTSLSPTCEASIRRASSLESGQRLAREPFKRELVVAVASNTGVLDEKRDVLRALPQRRDLEDCLQAVAVVEIVPEYSRLPPPRGRRRCRDQAHVDPGAAGGAHGQAFPAL